MNPLFDVTGDTITKAMLDGIKDTIKQEIKKHIWDEVDGMIETISLELAQRMYVNMNQHHDLLTDTRQIKMELLLGTPDSKKKFVIQNEAKIVEV